MYSIKLQYPLSLPLMELRDKAAKYRRDLNIRLINLFGSTAIFEFSCNDEKILKDFLWDWVDGDEKMFGILSELIEKGGLQTDT